MTPVGILWLVLVIAAVIATIATFVWLVFRGLEVWHVVRDIEFLDSPSTDTAPEPSRAPGPSQDPVTLSAARVAHARVKQFRHEGRNARLSRARSRWAEHDLVNGTAPLGAVSR